MYQLSGAAPAETAVAVNAATQTVRHQVPILFMGFFLPSNGPES